MALADYRLCDVCGCKAFYDANLNYNFDGKLDEPILDFLGDWSVICFDCAKSYKTIVIPKEST